MNRWFKPWHHLPRQRMADQAFNRSQQFVFFGRDQRHRMAGMAGAAGATDPMHVVLGHIR
jgi:hypothetical protein